MKAVQLIGMAAVAIAVAACPTVSDAAYVVDTGPGPSTYPGWGLADFQPRFAAQFTTNAPYTLTDISMWAISSFGGQLGVFIYDDGGELPGSNVLFSTTTSVPGTLNDAAWLGVSGLNWSLAPGTYWVSFEYVDSSFALPWPSVSPIGNEAYFFAKGSEALWVEQDQLNMGVRISGNEGSPVVPLPAAGWLLLSGLAGLGVLGRRRKAT